MRRSTSDSIFANCYHIVLSGNRRKALFHTAADRRALNKIAIDALKRFDATLHAYCLLPHHFRALVQIDGRLLVKALQRIATRYARHRQSESKSIDPLFERPYHAARVDDRRQFLQLLRSIHLSPVIANAAVTADDYRWSSHRAYLGFKSVTQITTDIGLAFLSKDRTQARRVYQEFISGGSTAIETLDIDRNTSLVGVDQARTDIDSLIDLPADGEPTALTRFGKTSLPRFMKSRARSRSRRYLSIY